jgi:hypothetical protein
MRGKSMIIHRVQPPHEYSGVRVGPKSRRDIQPSMEQPWSNPGLQDYGRLCRVPEHPATPAAAI